MDMKEKEEVYKQVNNIQKTNEKEENINNMNEVDENEKSSNIVTTIIIVSLLLVVGIMIAFEVIRGINLKRQPNFLTYDFEPEVYSEDVTDENTTGEDAVDENATQNDLARQISH